MGCAAPIIIDVRGPADAPYAVVGPGIRMLNLILDSVRWGCTLYGEGSTEFGMRL